MTGCDIIQLGIPEGPLVGEALKFADLLTVEGANQEFIKNSIISKFRPKNEKPKLDLIPFTRDQLVKTAMSFDSNTSDKESDNWNKVWHNMEEMTRVPIVEAAAIMPDACPAGPGITVGGVIETRNAIIPSAHSADICCSMFTSFFLPGSRSKDLMDNLVKSTEFGPGGSKDSTEMFLGFNNRFLNGLEKLANTHLGTQGDGNHFASLGLMQVTPKLINFFSNEGYYDAESALRGIDVVYALTTHHGSRGFGAEVFKRGQKAAEKYTATVANNIPKYAAWLDYTTSEGEEYWRALDTIRWWTEANHRRIHQKFVENTGVCDIYNIFNEHNFVWKDGNKFTHGKGATPVSILSSGQKSLGIIPLNMAEPILIVAGSGNDFLNFAPHGAGRNESRTSVLKEYDHLGDSRGISVRDAEAVVASQTQGLDIRWYNGRPDISESPLAYKSAQFIRDQIKTFELCDIVAEIQPLGCIMAGASPYGGYNRKKR